MSDGGISEQLACEFYRGLQTDVMFSTGISEQLPPGNSTGGANGYDCLTAGFLRGCLSEL